MRHYEVTFIVDPVLSSDEVKQTADMYLEQFKSRGCELVHVTEWGLKQLAFPVKKRTSGFYYTVELSCANGDWIDEIELAFRRDERVIRFLTVKLDKFGVQYNDDKSSGKIAKRREAFAAAKAEREAKDADAAE